MWDWGSFYKLQSSNIVTTVIQDQGKRDKWKEQVSTSSIIELIIKKRTPFSTDKLANIEIIVFSWIVSSLGYSLVDHRALECVHACNCFLVILLHCLYCLCKFIWLWFMFLAVRLVWSIVHYLIWCLESLLTLWSVHCFVYFTFKMFTA